jgi:hypothetical protein
MSVVAEIEAELAALRQAGRELAEMAGGAEDVNDPPHESSTSSPLRGGE